MEDTNNYVNADLNESLTETAAGEVLTWFSNNSVRLDQTRGYYREYSKYSFEGRMDEEEFLKDDDKIKEFGGAEVYIWAYYDYKCTAFEYDAKLKTCTHWFGSIKGGANAVTVTCEKTADALTYSESVKYAQEKGGRLATIEELKAKIAAGNDAALPFDND